MSSALSAERVDPAERVRLAECLSRQGWVKRAAAIAMEAMDDARQDGDEWLLARSADCAAYCAILDAQYEMGVSYARAAQAIWRARGRLAEAASSGGALATLLAYVGDPEAITEAAAAIHLAERSASPAAQVDALQAMCLCCTLLKQPKRGVPFGERAVALRRQHGVGSTWAYVSLGEAIVWSSTPEPADAPGTVAPTPLLRAGVARAVALSREGLVVVRAQGDGWTERLMLNNVAEYSLYVADTATAEAALAEVDAAAGEPTARCSAIYLLMQGRTLVARGLHETALQRFTAARALLAADELEIGSLCQSDLADTLAALGRFEAALAAHRTYHALFVRRASQAAECRARLCAVQEETEALRATAQQAQAEVSVLAARNDVLAHEAQRLQRSSIEDPLTGLANRRQLESVFREVLASATPFWLAMVDVDHFKRVNDRFSHLMGDAVLRRLGEILTVGMRSTDLAVRYGGEEFALLLRGTDPASAAKICERLRRAVETDDWGKLHPDLAVTVSLGLAGSNEGSTADQILAVADARLYSAKQNGRNRLVVPPS